MIHHFQRPRKLGPEERMGRFSCGVPFIDKWAAQRAPSSAQHGTAVAYVSFTASGEPAGFCTLSAYSVQRSTVSAGWLKRNTPEIIPSILIGMLGVDCHFQGGEGLGWMSLQDAIMRARSVSGALGSRALIVEPYDDKARAFYAHFGFQPIPGTTSMYLRLV